MSQDIKHENHGDWPNEAFKIVDTLAIMLKGSEVVIAVKAGGRTSQALNTERVSQRQISCLARIHSTPLEGGRVFVQCVETPALFAMHMTGLTFSVTG